MTSRYLLTWTAKMGQIISRNRNSREDLTDGVDVDCEAVDRQPALTRKPKDLPDGADEVLSLFSSIQSQAIDLQCQFAKATSEWNVALNVLTGRASTLEPLITDALKAAKESQRTVEILAASNEKYKLKAANTERELFYYRPMALRLEDELRVAKDQLEEQVRSVHALESDNAKAVGEYNYLFQKLAAATAANERATEENLAYSQKLSKNDDTIQTLLRNTAQLQSDLISATSALERAEKESAELADKLTAQSEELTRGEAAFKTIKQQMQALNKESAAQQHEAEERERQATEALVTKDKQIYEFEVKLASVNSKNDHLNRMVQRMRDDVRRHIDYIGTIEASNRQLLDALSRNTAMPAAEIKLELASKAPPLGGLAILRAVQQSERAPTSAA